ncbi:MAG TPA: hypothetical protein VNR60_01760 [Croceibacterium sp.]|nr:hypothetical protein [Croceibacterium sp.]
MADESGAAGSGRALVIALVVVVLLALIAWGAGLFDSGKETTYVAGAEDVGGGELIVTEPTDTGVAVDLPETPMTPVPTVSSPVDSPAVSDTPPSE